MDPIKKKRALRLLSNGVYVLTSRDSDRYGAATVTWVSQASFKPSLVMAAVRRESNVLKCMSESRIAALHILSRDQEKLASKFFSPTRAGDGSLNDEPVTDDATSAPILKNSPAYLICRVRQIIEGEGDHAVVIMEVIDAECREEVQPLTVADSPWQYGG